MDFVIAMTTAWAAWSSWHLALLVWQGTTTGTAHVAALLGEAVYVTGFFRQRVVVPMTVRARLSREELHAIVMHETGHIQLWHLRRNALRFVLLPFLPRSKGRLVRQELAADAFASALGHAAPLASALRKLSSDPFDLLRARLLEITAATDEALATARRVDQVLQDEQARRDAEDPSGRDDRVRTIREG